MNQQKRNNEFSDAQENYNSAVSSGNYSVQAAQNEAAIARQKLQDYYAQRDAAQNDVQDKIPDEEKFSDSSEFDDPGNTDDFGNTDDPENSDDSEIRIAQMAKGIKIHQETATILRSRH